MRDCKQRNRAAVCTECGTTGNPGICLVRLLYTGGTGGADTPLGICQTDRGRDRRRCLFAGESMERDVLRQLNAKVHARLLTLISLYGSIWLE